MCGLNSRWRKGTHLRIQGDVSGSWNRNLHERERAPTEMAYVASFHEGPGWHRGARVRRYR